MSRGTVRALSSILRAVSATPPDRLSDVELRLLAIADRLLPTATVLHRLSQGSAGEMSPLSVDAYVGAHRLAFAGAVELEEPLRQVRDTISGMEEPS